MHAAPYEFGGRVEWALLPVGRSKWASEPQRNKKKPMTKLGTVRRAPHCQSECPSQKLGSDCNVVGVLAEGRDSWIVQDAHLGWRLTRRGGTTVNAVLSSCSYVWSSDDQISPFQLPGCRTILDIAVLAGSVVHPERTQ